MPADTKVVLIGGSFALRYTAGRDRYAGTTTANTRRAAADTYARIVYALAAPNTQNVDSSDTLGVL